MSNAVCSGTTACWTCYVRHVKCDSTRPSCTQCSRRQVICHGFGPRPSWLDGGPEEAKERGRIKLAVKKNFSALRKSQNRARRKPSHIQLVDPSEPSASGVGRDLVSTGQISPGTGDRGKDSVTVTVTRSSSAQSCHRVDGSGYRSSEAPLLLNHQPQTHEASYFDLHEATLMMHYLDRVYPWQFPLHNRESQLGNRGWLLSLLSRRGPLYHAAMSLAALHRAWQNGQTEEFQANHKALDHRAKALREMHQFLAIDKAAYLLQDKLRLAEILACSVLLISFEVFNGGERDWCLHLDAITNLISGTEPNPIISCLPSNGSEQLLSDGQTTFTNDLSAAGIGFLLVDILWFDLFACLSADRVPVLPYKSWLKIPGLHTADVMGCENCMMQAIGDICMLRQWKEGREVDGSLSVLQLAAKAQAIQQSIEEEIARIKVSPLKAGKFTELFASAALIWLYTIVSGPVPSLPEIRNEVSQSILLIGQIEDVYSLRGAVWALCIAGCVAEEQTQPFFTNIFTILIDKSGKFGNSATAFKIVQESWSHQKNCGGKGLAIKDCISSALLI